MLGLFTACAPPLTEGYGPMPDAQMAKRSGSKLEQLQEGYVVYQKQCRQCHPYPMLPHEVSAGDWHVVVPGMAWNAGIDKAEEEAVLEYLLAARKMPAPKMPQD